MRQPRNETLIKVLDYIKRAIAQHPIKEEGKTYSHEVRYMNGNDGTGFDWGCNYRTCEFFVFYEGGEDALGYVKVYVTREGNIEGYVWDTERYSGGVRLKPEPLEPLSRDCYSPEDEARAFKNYIAQKTDYKCIWDKPIATI